MVKCQWCGADFAPDPEDKRPVRLCGRCSERDWTDYALGMLAASLQSNRFT